MTVDFEMGVTVLSPGLPLVIDKLFSEEPEPLEGLLLLTARPKISVTLWNDGRTQVAGFVEQPFIAVSSAVVPTPGLSFPATTDGRWGLGDPDAGVSVRWHDILSAALVSFLGVGFDIGGGVAVPVNPRVMVELGAVHRFDFFLGARMGTGSWFELKEVLVERGPRFATSVTLIF